MVRQRSVPHPPPTHPPIPSTSSNRAESWPPQRRSIGIPPISNDTDQWPPLSRKIPYSHGYSNGTAFHPPVESFPSPYPSPEPEIVQTPSPPISSESTQQLDFRSSETIVCLEKVTKIFPNGICALDEVDLQVQRGDFIFVMGASGAGKSTLLRLLYGAERATQGTITVNHVSLDQIRPRPLAMLRRRLGVVFQDYGLLPNRTVSENVAFVLRAQGIPQGEIRRRLGPTLKMVGLTEKKDRFPHELSGGEQQRLSLARAIVNTPVLLLADEPTGNLDWENSVLVLQILERLNSFGVTIMMTSHDPYLVERNDHRIIRIEDGHLYNLR